MKPETVRLMIENHNPAGFTPRGPGFAVGKHAGSPGCTEQTFGHTGSTGTLCWADPASDTICVVPSSFNRKVSQSVLVTRQGPLKLRLTQLNHEALQADQRSSRTLKD